VLSCVVLCHIRYIICLGVNLLECMEIFGIQIWFNSLLNTKERDSRLESDMMLWVETV
jgi:hypothetical protein